ncbi:MAG: DUF3656 domain-containing protein, partial [Alphaproteobacteria bacterium]|nr:DUF3656 domain-containing protein [Alphaproteobacteria bacterium]
MLSAPLKRGDGLVVEGGLAGQGELGGRVWSIVVGKLEVEAARPGQRALVWLGPDKAVEGVVAGRRVFQNSDPAVEKEILRELETDPVRRPIDVRLSGRLGERPRFFASTRDGVTVEVNGLQPLEPARSAPLDAAVLRDKLGRLGDTP